MDREENQGLSPGHSNIKRLQRKEEEQTRDLEVTKEMGENIKPRKHGALEAK